MSIGTSGRVVIEIEPELKKALHAALAADGLTLKQWFVAHAEEFLDEALQLPLPFASSDYDADAKHV